MTVKIISRFLRQKGLQSLALVLICFTCSSIIINHSSNYTKEQNLPQEQEEYQVKLQNLEALHRNKIDDVMILARYLESIDPNFHKSKHNSALNFNTFIDLLSPESKEIIKIIMESPHQQSSLPINSLDSSFKLEILESKSRTGVSIVMGIPTIKRDKQSYLMNTLESLISNMSEDEQKDTLIVVFIAETNLDYVLEISDQIKQQFQKYCDIGLVEIISPPASYYPDWNKLRITLGDPLERVKWRSKQNLDFAFLMKYSQNRGTFYVQLEDDILTKAGYVTTMKQFALNKIEEQSSWILIDFCLLGFIGKMFKTTDLPNLITFFKMFFNDKPVDWLLEDFISTKVCSPEKDTTYCNAEKANLRLRYIPSLFQHIGVFSSLKGKSQILKDKHFGDLARFYPHKDNPPAKIQTQIIPYQIYTLEKAYNGETFFWGMFPQSGNYLEFIFNNATTIRNYLFRSGSLEYPSDKFYNTTVEVLPDNLKKNSSLWQQYNITSDGFIVVGNFDTLGIAEGLIDEKIGKLREIRLHVHSSSQNYAILTEIFLK